VLVVAIDGPAGVGKSTIARMLADDLEWAYLDTGAMYRAVTLRALRDGIRPDDAQALAELAPALAIHLSANGRVSIDGEDVTPHIRSTEVTSGVSAVAGVAAVRKVMVGHQHAFASENERIVAEGRDMGTVVFPEAQVKVYLEADPRERARRRLDDEGARTPADIDDVQAGIERRDRQDSTRAASPLKPAADAWILDTTHMTLREVFEAVRSRVRSAIRPRPGN